MYWRQGTYLLDNSPGVSVGAFIALSGRIHGESSLAGILLYFNSNSFL